MQGLFLLTLSFLATFVTSKYSNLKPLVHVKDKFEYIPIVTAIIVADLLIVWITFSKVLGDGKAWQISTKWYKKYRLSAMMADILIGVIYLLMARQFVYSMNMDTTLFGFGVVAVIIHTLFTIDNRKDE